MKVILAQPGTQHAFQLARQLDQNQLLFRFYTLLAVHNDSVWAMLLSQIFGSKISTRTIKLSSSKILQTNFLLEIRALWQLRTGRASEQVMFNRNQSFQRWIPEQDIKQSDFVIGFDTSSWILAERCKNLGVRFILDQSIAHPLAKEKVLYHVRHQYPSWAEGIPQKPNHLIAIEQQEHVLADKIVVASSFTRRSLTDYDVDGEKVVVNPYGVDFDRFKGTNKQKHERCTFVFVGSVTARKGIPLLLESWKQINANQADLIIIGPASVYAQQQLAAYENVRYQGQISNAELPNIFELCDVFVFPSFFEGFGLVLLEAMACGLPVIATPETAAPDLITDGVEGFIIKDKNAITLANHLNYFIEQKSRAEEMGAHAMTKAQQYSWDAYGLRWKALLEKI